MPYRGKYQKESTDSYKISRSGIEEFVRCARCFYLDKKLGVKQPDGLPFSLNSAVDYLLKKEFDIHRAAKTPHPLMKAYGINAVPFDHEQMKEWRENFKGVQFHHKATNLYVTGAVDDLWVSPEGELMVVDYKATSKNDEVTLDADWQMTYKRQMEVYQWLLRQNGFKVNKTGYFVYCNGRKDKEAFDGKLEFNIKVIPYEGDDSWIENTLLQIQKCLDKDAIPKAAADCKFCAYRLAAKAVEKTDEKPVSGNNEHNLYYRTPCPECGARKAKKYFYGLPYPETISERDISAGCCIDEDDLKKWHCEECGNDW